MSTVDLGPIGMQGFPVENHVKKASPAVVEDAFISRTGDDIAPLMNHKHGVLKKISTGWRGTPS